MSFTNINDRRLTPATDLVALDSLRGQLDRPSYVPGRAARLTVPVADIFRAPAGKRDRQANFGADVTLIEERGDWAFVQTALDDYCGWVRTTDLGFDLPEITHRVATPASHIYSEPDLKSPELGGISIGARLSVVDRVNKFVRLAGGGWVPEVHVSDRPALDAGDVAESMAGTPYLWGGNSRWGIDCSGLAQCALSACGIACPGDSDMQDKYFAKVEGPLQRGDLLFWPGHVAMALDAERMIHATGFIMGVIAENTEAAIARIDLQGDGPYLGARRPDPKVRAAFP